MNRSQAKALEWQSFALEITCEKAELGWCSRTIELLLPSVSLFVNFLTHRHCESQGDRFEIWESTYGGETDTPSLCSVHMPSVD